MSISRHPTAFHVQFWPENSWNNVLPNFLKPILVFQNDRLAWVAATALNLPESHLSVSYWSHRPTIQPTIVYNSIWNICKRISSSSPGIVNLLQIIEKYCLVSTISNSDPALQSDKDITGLWLSAVVGVGVDGVGVDDLCGDGFCGDVVVVRDVWLQQRVQCDVMTVARTQLRSPLITAAQ